MHYLSSYIYFMLRVDGAWPSVPKITCLEEFHVIIHILGPVFLVLLHGEVKPWLHVPIIMNDSRRLDVLLADIGVVSQAKHMPTLFDGFRGLVECDETRR